MIDTRLYKYMKKNIFSLLFLASVSLSLPLVSPAPVQILAVTQSAPPATVAQVPPVVSSDVTVEYVLPYPGILPTHPLYFLKMMRDQIVEVLISDPVKRADFYITQADKKLSMALALSDARKTKEMIRALDDAVMLRQKSIKQLEDLRVAKQEIPGYISDQLTRSLVKHLEVVTQLKQEKEEVQGLIKRSLNLKSGK
jgi:hypothetical protein